MKNRTQARNLLLAALAATALIPSPAHAATLTWNGTGGATWNTTDTNWTPTSGTTPWDSTNGTTSNATFDGANTPSVSGTVYVNQITKSATAGTTTISGGNITLAGASPTITNNGTAGLTISSKLSGTNGVTVTLPSGAGSSGSITFGGTNDYSGTTTINGNPSTNGLTVTNNGALGTSSVLVNANGILKVSTSGISNAMTLNGGAGNGAIQAFASTTLSGPITLASDAVIGNRGNGTTLSLTGGINTTGGANRTLTLNILANPPSYINNAITISTNSVNLGTGGTLNIGDGIASNGTATMNLNVANNTWGTIIVRANSSAGVTSGATLNLGAADALGGSGAVLQLGGATSANESITVDLKGNSQTVAGLRSFTGSGSANATGTRIVTNSGSAATLTVNNTSSYLYDGQINGAIALTKSGNSTLTLSGSSNYTGATTVSGNGSVLAISHANALGATSGNTTVGNLASLQLSGNISVAEVIELNGYGTIRTSGAGGALRNVSGTNTVTSGISLGNVASENWIASAGGTLNLTGGVTSPNRDLTLVGGGGLNVTTNAINLGTGALTVFGQGATPVSIGVASNTASTLTVYYGGKLRTDVANAFSSSTALFMGNSDTGASQLDLNGNNQIFGSLYAGNNTSGVITSASAATLSVNQTANNTYGGTITGAVGLTKSGSSTLTLSGNNTYTGNTTVSLGTLLVNGSTSASSAVSVSSGATLGGNGTVNGATTLAGGTIGSSGSTLALSSTLSSSGNSSVATGSTVNVAGGSTVTSGTLLINGTLGGALNVTGGTVGGNGTTAALTVGASGTLAPGNSPGILNTGNLSLSGALSMEINGATVGTQYDRVNVLGTVNLVSGNTLALTLGYAPTIGTNFFLINNDGGDAIVGNLNGYAQGATFTVSSQQFQISYTGDSGTNSFSGSGNDLVIQAVPEPSTWAMLAFSLTTVMVLRRRRQS